jgi:hypothetical protein
MHCGYNILLPFQEMYILELQFMPHTIAAVLPEYAFYNVNTTPNFLAYLFVLHRHERTILHHVLWNNFWSTFDMTRLNESLRACLAFSGLVAL